MAAPCRILASGVAVWSIPMPLPDAQRAKLYCGANCAILTGCMGGSIRKAVIGGGTRLAPRPDLPRKPGLVPGFLFL